MKPIEKQKTEVLNVYDTWLNANLNGNVKTYDSYSDDEYRFIGSTDNEDFLNRTDTTKFFAATADQLAGKVKVRNSKKTIEKFDEIIFITDLFDAYFLNGSNWVYYGKFRFTSALKRNDEGWKFVYQHFSTPDLKAQEGETIGTEQIAAENLELREAVKRRTIELEQKSRELEIEAALEKVRSSSIAMHNSDQLREIVKVVFEKLKELKFAIDGAAFVGTMSENFDSVNFWIGDDHAEYPSCFNFPQYDAPTITDVWNAKKSGVDFISKTYSIKEKNIWFDYAFNNTDLKTALPEDLKKWILEQEYLTQSFAIQKNSMVGVHFHHAKTLSGNEIDILKRFSRVFEQSYVRFLDLQKAEAQAREAQIEAALEKVRSRSLAMHNSDELQEVISSVFQQMQNLGLKADASLINILTDESKDFYLWIGTGRQAYAQKIRIPYIKHPVFDVFYEARDSGKTFLTNALTRAEKDSFFEYAFKYSDLKLMPEDRKKYVMESAGFARSFAWSKNSGITIQNYAGIPYTNKENEILKRFARVFEQAYTRFLDVKKAEAQARKAQIEAALETVRSRSLAMHNTAELTEVLTVLHEKLIELKVDFDSANILIFSEHTKDIEYWTINNEQQKFQRFNLPYVDYSAALAIANARQNKLELLKLNFQGEAHNELLKYLFEESDFKNLPDERKKILKDSGNYTFSIGIGNRIGIQINSYYRKAFSDEENEILQRFTSVFEQAYIRFIDLQTAEAQVREVVKQASLDRVRGEIASMRTKDDLNRITPLIWKELNTLGVPFVRCGVFIMDETNELLQTYLSTPKGDAIAAFHIAYETPGNFAEVVRRWRNNESYLHHWGETEFRNLAEILLKKGSINSLEQYMASLPKDGLHLHFLPFLQGMLYVGNEALLNSEHLQLVQTLANAFSTAYARYEDFNNLETAKAQIELTLSELKSTQAQLIQSEKMASLGELTAGIAHEIQNPLNFVNNFSEVSNELLHEMKEELVTGNLQLATELTDDVIQNLEKITHHGKRADAIVKGMLQHSRSSTGIKEPTDINALADEYLRLSYHGLRAKDKSFNADFKTEFDESLPKIDVIPQDIGRVLLNLINNAFYAVGAPSNTPPRPPKGGSRTPKLSINRL